MLTTTPYTHVHSLGSLNHRCITDVTWKMQALKQMALPNMHVGGQKARNIACLYRITSSLQHNRLQRDGLLIASSMADLDSWIDETSDRLKTQRLLHTLLRVVLPCF